MSWKEVDRACPGCQPAILDPVSGTVLPDTDPLMVSVLAEWGVAPKEDLEAFHRITCQNSRDQKDHARVQAMWGRVLERVKAGERASLH